MSGAGIRRVAEKETPIPHVPFRRAVMNRGSLMRLLRSVGVTETARGSDVSTKYLRVLCFALLLAARQAPAAAQGTFTLFGSRNHPELTWSIYDTEHFRVVYSDGLAEVAKRAGSIAEQAYDIQRQTLSLAFRGRHHIFISDRDQIPNAGTSPFGYTFIYVNPARYLTLFSSSTGWLEEVIPHELVHALIFENTRGWLEVVLPLAGGSVPRDIHEGMAQFYGGETWGVERGDRYLNLLIRNGETRPRPLAIDAGLGEYALGFAKLKWLRQTVSDQEIGTIFARGDGHARFRFGKAFSRVTGRAYADVEKEWRQAMNVYYNWRAGTAEPTQRLGPTLEEAEADYLLVVKRSPHGEGLAFSGVKRLQSPDFALYYHDYNTRRLKRLAEKNIRDNFSFDPGGRRIAFTRWHYGTHGDIIADIYLVDVRTGEETRVTEDMRALEPLFVGAEELVFVKQDGLVSNFYRLSLADGATLEKLTGFSNERHFADLSVSGDGRYVLAAYVHPEAKSQGIVMLDLATKTVVEKPQSAIIRFPLFAPHTNNEILFTSEEGGVLNVYRLDVNNGTRTTVTRQADSVLVTDWREEGRAIGIRQFDVERNEAFALDPYRLARDFPAELQPHYSKWLETEPGTKMAFDNREAPGQFRGSFHSLSTFRPLGVIPALAMIKNRPAIGLVALAADMPGSHLLSADVLSDFRSGSRLNGGVRYLNRTSDADIAAQAGYRDVTTFSFYGKDDLYEGIWSARLELSLKWPLDARYGTHRLHLGAAAENSEVLSQPGTTAADVQPVFTEPAQDYRLWSVFAAYRFSEVRPHVSFPIDATGSAVSYEYNRSLAGSDFSFHTLRLSAYRLQAAAQGRIKLFASATLEGQVGAAPAQLRLGMAKYGSGNSLLRYSSQIHVRGGEQYLPGNRQFTTTMELRLPVLDLLEPFAFLDVFRAWGEGASVASEHNTLLAAGGGLRLPPVLGSSLEMGWARQISGAPRHDWRFYVTVQRVLPFE